MPPLSVLKYRLTYVDALAYERLPGEWTGWQKVALFLPLFAIGALAGLIEDFTSIYWWLAVIGLLAIWAAAGLVIVNWRIHRRARAMALRHGQTVVEEWGDHLAIRSEAGSQFLANELIGKVIIADGHVFVLYHGGPLILPLRAFEDRDAMCVFGEALDRRSAESVP